MSKDEISFKNRDRFIQMGIAISSLRKMRGMSQEQLAEKASISRSHLSAIEAPNMVRAFSMEAFFNIADALDVTPEELIQIAFLQDKILKRNNFKHLSVYQLRHLFATRCIDVNIPVNQIKQYLGHALASTTMDYYVEYDEDTNKAEIEKLEQVNNIQVVPEFLKGMEQIMSIPKNRV